MRKLTSAPSLRSSLLVLTVGVLAACGSPGDDGATDTDDDASVGVGGGLGEPSSGGSGIGGTGVGGNGGGSGGLASGGGPASGGDGSGGDAPSGGTSSGGGSSTGGTDTGGSNTGGTSSGGSNSTGGGSSTGGSSSCNTAVRAPSAVGYGRLTTGGQGGNTITVSTGTQLHAALCGRAADDTPLIIRVNGTLTPGNTTKQSGSCNTADGVIEIKDVANITIQGVGTAGVLDQVGLHIRNSSNIIVQNLTIKNVRKSNTSTPSNGGDAIGMETDVDRVWIDHNLIFGSTTQGEEHDGLIDFKAHVTNVTVSYNHLHTGGRGGLIGSNDDGDDGSTNITFHHNWYQNLTSRTHLIREADAHLYDNYYSDILDTGINSRNGATLLVENNYFTEARNPLGTFFYTTNPGTWEVHDNYFSPSVVWESAADELPAGPNVQTTGDTSVPYSYTLDPAACVPAILATNVGVGKI
ncbi:MAG TPA: hypothetical protein VLC09_13400 [Polyangiaceae bacterium]|nr:hypothetical protein [Polyangiaceae bacterium]